MRKVVTKQSGLKHWLVYLNLSRILFFLKGLMWPTVALNYVSKDDLELLILLPLP